jgi:tetratricopeptide (TPR) repeat protein
MEALKASQQKVPGLYRTMAYLSIQQHQFNRADSFLQNAIKIEGLTVANAFLEFDVVFEKGQYKKAKNLLESLKKGNSYGYLFRRAKFEHYDGNLDSAISCMIQAANKAGSSKYLRQSALSNAGDLLLHKGAVENAAKLYRESIKIDASDLHSITGLGNIALLYDKNDTLAEKIFKYVQKNTNAPDILLKLIQVTEARNDSIQMMKYANEFVNKASAPEYGNMYNKYLIDLYTGIINKPEKAIELAENEINSRPTAQIFAWYAWSLSRNKEVDKAYTIYKGHISSQPLEGLELYYMGKMMKGLDKEYNAQQFFKAAWKNRFDLGPAKQLELKEYLSQ